MPHGVINSVLLFDCLMKVSKVKFIFIALFKEKTHNKSTKIKSLNHKTGTQGK